MDTEAALLQALHDRPDDDLAWLALADCLEEQGQAERAELVRLQRELRGPLSPGKARQALERRLAALLASGVVPCAPTVTNSVGMRLALIPPGTFWMGSPSREPERNANEGPRHRVEIAEPFYLGAHLVTQEQYEEVVGRDRSAFRPGGESEADIAGLDTRDFPAEQVTWTEAVAFCKRLTRLSAERKAGRKYRLPTEAEWEYACRAGTTTAFHYGPRLSSAQANFNGEHPSRGLSEGRYLGRPTPVGSYKPNAFGLYDMHGNVWEWCADYFAEDHYANRPPGSAEGPPAGTERVLRGGCWYWHAREARSAFRSRVGPSYRNYCVGFRVAMERG
jgi:uncharacterized protein (TIGR02996 family)